MKTSCWFILDMNQSKVIPEEFINFFCKVVHDFRIEKKIKYVTVPIYTDKDYIKRIIFVLCTGIQWSFIDLIYEYFDARAAIKITGNTLNKQHIWYCKNHIYERVNELLVRESFIFFSSRLVKHKYKLFITDTSKIINRCGNEYINKSGYGGHKKCIKIAVIVNEYDIAVAIHIFSGNTNDSTTVRILLEKLITPKIKDDNIKKFMLADKIYYTKNVLDLLGEFKYTPIIAQNKKNIQNESKLVHLPIRQKRIYVTKQIIVEHYFSWIKNFRRVNQYTEKNITIVHWICIFGFFINYI